MLVALHQQSDQIAAGVHLNRREEDIGAGDQGLMFGYATDETEECMPLTVVLAHKLNQRISELRRSGEFWWARPDSKTQVGFDNIRFNFVYGLLNRLLTLCCFCFVFQVTCEYSSKEGACIPKRVHTVVASVQHSEKISLEELRSELMTKVCIQSVLNFGSLAAQGSWLHHV